MHRQKVETFETACETVIKALNAQGGVIRKVVNDWTLQGGQGGTSVIEAQIVAALLARGKLVPHPKGGLEPLSRAMARSGKITAHRPERPRKDAALPTINNAESPLAWLRARKGRSGGPLISDEQYAAGERLRSDFEKSRLERRTTANWDPSQTAGGGSGNRAADLTDAMIAARQNLQRALAAVGPELSAMLVQVCCLSAGIEQAERLLEIPQRAGKAVLSLALTSLARHYGFLKPARPRDRGATIAHWAIEGYRPGIAPCEAS